MKIKTTKHAFEAIRVVLINYLEGYINTQLQNCAGLPQNCNRSLSAVMVANIFDELMDYMATRSMQTMKADTKLNLKENLAIALYIVLPKVPLNQGDFFTIAHVNNWIQQLDKQMHEIELYNQLLIH